MQYKVTKLANGLEVLCVPMPSLASATLTVWVRTGSRSETTKIMGISHFLEHMAFKGGQKFTTAKEVSEAIDGIGGEFNAATSKDWTCFYVKAGALKIERAFDVIADMLIQPALRQSDIDREKGVIVEEMNMYEDTPLYKIGDLFENIAFKGHLLANDVIGSKETVTAFTKNNLKRYIAKHYVTQNMLIAVAGGITVAQITKLANKYFGKLAKGAKNKVTKYIHNQTKPRVLLKTKNADQAHLILGFIGLPNGHKDRYTEAVLSTILGEGMSSRLFTEIREKRGLAYSVRTSTDKYEDTGLFTTYAGVEIAKAYEAVQVILQEHIDLANSTKPISGTELTKAKEYLKGHLALSLEDTKAVNAFFALKKLFTKKITTPEEISKELDKVTAKQVVALAKKLFVPQTLNLAVIGPFKSAGKFETILLSELKK